MASTFVVPVVKLTNFREHPNASLLGIVDVLGYQMVVPLVEKEDGEFVRTFNKGERDDKGKRVPHDGVKEPETVRYGFKYSPDKLYVYFPADSVIPQAWVDEFGVRDYLKGGDKDRVGRIQLRGEPSFGLIVELPKGVDWKEDDNVAEFYKAVKYEPPIRATCGDAESRDPLVDPFVHKFTDIENGRLKKRIFEDGEEVIVTEKIHGTSCAVGCVGSDKVLVARSMEIRRRRPTIDPEFDWEGRNAEGTLVKKNSRKPFKSGNKVNTVKGVIDHPELPGRKAFTFVEDDSYVECNKCLPEDFIGLGPEAPLDSEEVKRNTYWFPFSLKGVFPLVNDLSSRGDVLLYGEVYGGSIQTLDYGIPKGKGLGFAAFGIRIDGRFIDWDEFKALCDEYGVPTVPVVCRGPFSMEKMKELADGKSTMANHMREGVVVYPVKERENPRTGRAILKFIGTEYALSKHMSLDTKDF